MKTKENLNKGVTLVVLVITIIILLILVGISIVSFTRNEIFEKAKSAKEKQEKAQIQENEILEGYVNEINKKTNNNTESVALIPDYEVNNSITNYITASNSNYYYIPGNALNKDKESCWSSYPNVPAWIQYDFVNRVCVTKVKIEPHDLASAPKTFKLSGSNDGGTFEIIYEGSHSQSADSEIFEFSNTKSFRYMRIEVSEVYEGDGATISNLQFYGKIDDTEPVALIPDYEVNNSITNYITASNSNYQYVPGNALNKDKESCWSSYPNVPAWIQYDFVNKVCVTKVKIEPLGSASAPKVFRVTGSNDGEKFEIIYEGTHSKSADSEIFEFSNTKSFRYMRIEVSEVYEGNGATISNLQFYGKMEM